MKFTKDEIIKQHFHGFSDEQWKELKNQFPYNEIPYIIDHFVINLLRDADIPNLSEILKDNYYKDKNI